MPFVRSAVGLVSMNYPMVVLFLPSFVSLLSLVDAVLKIDEHFIVKVYVVARRSARIEGVVLT